MHRSERCSECIRSSRMLTKLMTSAFRRLMSEPMTSRLINSVAGEKGDSPFDDDDDDDDDDIDHTKHLATRKFSKN